MAFPLDPAASARDGEPQGHGPIAKEQPSWSLGSGHSRASPASPWHHPAVGFSGRGYFPAAFSR